MFTGTETAEVELAAGADVAALRHTLLRQFEALGPALPTMRVAVNQSFATDKTVLSAGDEVALIPPVSGG